MQSWFINLDDRPDRRAHIERAFAGIGVVAERIAGRTPETLIPHELAMAAKLAPAEIACAFSHRAAWQRIVESGAAYGAVFEDDLHLRPETAHFLQGEDWIPAGADVVKLETVFRPVLVGRTVAHRHDGYKVRRLYSGHYGAAAYIISARAAAFMLAEWRRIDEPVDEVLFDPVHGLAGRLAIWQVEPAPCIQDMFLPAAQRIQLGSATAAGRAARFRARGDTRPKGFAKFRHESRRILRQAGGFVWWLVPLPETVRRRIPAGPWTKIAYGTGAARLLR